MVNSDGTILHKTGHDRGRKHDYEIFKNKHPTTPLKLKISLTLVTWELRTTFPL